MNTIPRIHMVDAKTQTAGERAMQAQRIGEFIAGMIVGAIVFGALTYIVGRLW